MIGPESFGRNGTIRGLYYEELFFYWSSVLRRGEGEKTQEMANVVHKKGPICERKVGKKLST